MRHGHEHVIGGVLLSAHEPPQMKEIPAGGLRSGHFEAELCSFATEHGGNLGIPSIQFPHSGK